MKLSWRRLTAAQLNGLSVSLGVALVMGLLNLLFDPLAALAAAGGAVCASLTDVSNAPPRVWRRVIPAVLLSSVVTLATGLLRNSPVEMTLLIAATAFITLMTMAWGARAGQLSFSGVLALVFAMAWAATETPHEALVHSAWVLLGGVLYALWARAMAVLLRRRYRELAVAVALRAAVQRLHSRAARVASLSEVQDDSVRASMHDDVAMAEALQAARDQVFSARSSVHSRRQVDMLLALIEMRDLLLASRLDIGLLGEDAAGLLWRRALAQALLHLADVLEQLAAAVSDGGPAPQFSAQQWREELMQRIADVPAAADDPRRPLLASLLSRTGHMLDDVAAMTERFSGPDRPARLSPAQLQQFVSPEGWPLAALKNHFNLQSGVMRHALRSTLAFSAAYLLGLVLPWAAHPHWLVLSVAVVLRGNLEQTLERRNERIIGTVNGCLLVLVLAHVHSAALLALVFVSAVGVSHAYVNVRYRVAAVGSTLMALLQPLLLHPGHGAAVAERLADTVLGALLGWAFCFVLPSWERRSLQRVARQLSKAMARHAGNVLRWAPTPAQQLALRLSRQQAYAALFELSSAGQRTRVEPAHVQLPQQRTEMLLTHAFRLMALLGTVQQLLNRRAHGVNSAQAEPALKAAREACVASLLATEALPAAALGDPGRDGEQADWPELHDDIDFTPWLLRRLALCEREARWMQAAEWAVLTHLEAPPERAVSP